MEPALPLNEFYALADFKRDVRCVAVEKILQSVKQTEDDRNSFEYCINRLVKGMMSSRGAVRVGYSVALTEMIRNANDAELTLVLTSVENLTHNKEKNNKSDVYFGQALSYLCFCEGISSAKITADICDKLVPPLTALFGKLFHLNHICIQAIISLCSKCDADVFKESVWPHIKSICKAGLESVAINNLWLVIALEKRFEKVIKKKCPLASLHEQLITNDDLKAKIAPIITASFNAHPVTHPGAIAIFEKMFSNDESLALFCNEIFIGKMLKNEHKANILSAYQLLLKVLDYAQDENQLKLLLNKSLFESLLKNLCDRSPTSRFSRRFASEFLDKLCAFLRHKNSAAYSFVALNGILGVAVDFDRLANQKVASKLLVSLIGQCETAALADQYLDPLCDVFATFAKKVGKDRGLDDPSATYAVKTIGLIFRECTRFPETRWKSAQKLINFLSEDWPADGKKIVKDVVLDCVECLFDVVIKPNLFDVGLREENAGLIQRIIESLPTVSDDEKLEKLIKKAKKAHKKCLSGDGASTDVLKAFAVLLQYFSLATLLYPDHYDQTLNELLICYKECVSSQPEDNIECDKPWLRVLIDLALSLLSRHNRHLLMPIQVSMHYLSAILLPEHFEPIFKVLRVDKSDETLAIDVDEDKSDTGSIDDDREEEEESGEAADSGVDELSSDSEQEIDIQAVNEQLEKAVEKALSDANALETASVHSDLSDDTMLRLDDKLADVFRTHAKGQKSKAEVEQQAHAFRMRCFDLLLVLVHSVSDSTVLVKMVLPLLEIVRHCSKSKDEQGVSGRARFILNALCIGKPKEIDSTDPEFRQILIDVVDRVFDLSKNAADLVFQKCCSDSLRFVLKIAEKRGFVQDGDDFSTQLEVIFDRNLSAFLDDSQCLTSDSLFHVLLEKNAANLWRKLPIFGDALNSDRVRLFRKIVVCSFCSTIFRKIDPTKADGKKLRKCLEEFRAQFLKCFFGQLDQVLNFLEKNDSQLKLSKPTFLVQLIKLAQLMFGSKAFNDLKGVDESDRERLREILTKLCDKRLYRVTKSNKQCSLMITALKKNFNKNVHALFSSLRKRMLPDDSESDGANAKRLKSD